MRWKFILLCACLFCGSGCAIIDGEEDNAEPPSAFYLYRCGPVGGILTEVFLPEKEATCDDVTNINYNEAWSFTFTRMALWGEFPSDSIRTYPLNFDGGTPGARLGWAGHCTASETSCVEARSGALEIVDSTGNLLRIRADLAFENDQRVAGEYLLQQCKPGQPVLCF